jgi:hypothetical protein
VHGVSSVGSVSKSRTVSTGHDIAVNPFVRQG